MRETSFRKNGGSGLMIAGKSCRLFMRGSAIATSAMALFTAQAQAQLLTLGDVIDDLLALDATVTVQGQLIGGLQDSLNTQTAVIADINLSLQQNGGDITLIDNELTTINNTLNAVAGDVTQIQSDIVNLGSDRAANDARDDAQDGRLNGHDADIGALDTGLAANGARDDAQDGRLNGHDVEIGTLDTGLVANDARDDAQDGRLDDHDAAFAALDSGLATSGGRDDAQDVRLDGHDADVSGLNARLAANDTRDDGQDLRMESQDVVLASHDTRLTFAQQTGDNALDAVAVLRSDVDQGRAGLVRVEGSGEISLASTQGGTYLSVAGSDGDRRIGGVASGTASTDAANVGQMHAGDAATLQSAMAYADTRIASVDFDISALRQDLESRAGRLRKGIDRAAAESAALAGLPQPFIPGKGMLAIGIGGRGNESAIAVGVGKAFQAPSIPVVRAAAAINPLSGSVTYNAAVGIHF